MTLKQKLTIKNLPKNQYNISKSMREAGYTDQTSRSGSQYNTLRKYTSKFDFFSEDAIRRDIASTRRLAKKKEDITNMNRIDEHRSKIAGLITDKQKIEGDVTKVIIAYPQPIATQADKATPTENNG